MNMMAYKSFCLCFVQAKAGCKLAYHCLFLPQGLEMARIISTATHVAGGAQHDLLQGRV